ncbi:MAG: hypothetical protein AAF367_19360 [Pseudomonadota bacterium]
MSIATFVRLNDCARAAGMHCEAFRAFLATVPGATVEVKFGKTGLFDFDLAATLGELAERTEAGAAHSGDGWA